MKCLFEAYQDFFGIIFSVMFYSTFLSVIYFSFVLLSSESLPILIIIPMCGADSVLFVIGYLLSGLTTRSHLLSKELVAVSTRSVTTLYDHKFWKSMRPVKAYAGQFCSFETREFILFLGGEVIMKSIIDLLVALK